MQTFATSRHHTEWRQASRGSRFIPDVSPKPMWSNETPGQESQGKLCGQFFSMYSGGMLI